MWGMVLSVQKVGVPRTPVNITPMVDPTFSDHTDLYPNRATEPSNMCHRLSFLFMRRV